LTQTSYSNQNGCNNKKLRLRSNYDYVPTRLHSIFAQSPTKPIILSDRKTKEDCNLPYPLKITTNPS
jgi:hypothetical protein